jgi:hypothetical protein
LHIEGFENQLFPLKSPSTVDGRSRASAQDLDRHSPPTRRDGLVNIAESSTAPVCAKTKLAECRITRGKSERHGGLFSILVRATMSNLARLITPPFAP